MYVPARERVDEARKGGESAARVQRWEEEDGRREGGGSAIQVCVVCGGYVGIYRHSLLVSEYTQKKGC